MAKGREFIDCHIHLYKWFDDNGKDFFQGLDDFQAKCGATSLNICSLPEGIWGDVSNNIMAALYKLHNPSAFAYGGLVYPSMPVQLPFPKGMEMLVQYQELMDIGFDGIKIIETKPTDIKALKLPINHVCYDDFFRQAEKDGTHFIWHVADPKNFWDINCKDTLPTGWFYGNGEYPSYQEIFDWVYEILDKYPKLNVTFAHFFFAAEEPEVLDKLFAKYPNVGVDITPGTEMYETFHRKHEFYKGFFEKYAHRIMFGTDCSFPAEGDNLVLSKAVYEMVTTDKIVDNIWGVKAKGFAFSEEISDKILFNNFSAKHDKPKTINKLALKKYIEKYVHLVLDARVKSEIEKYTKILLTD